MIRAMIASLALYSGIALAAEPAAAPAAAPAPTAAPAAAAAPATAPAAKPDLSKLGPWSRKPTNEKATKKEIADYYKQMDDLQKKGDHEAVLAKLDFPVYMGTDNAKGLVTAEAWDKDKYVAMMKPFWESMSKDSKVTHRLATSVLSDSLVSVIDDFTMTMGKQKMAGRNQMLLVKRDGQWKGKAMVEAGWGDMSAPAPMAAVEAPKPAATASAAPTK